MITHNIIVYRPEMLPTQLKAVVGYFDKIRVLNSVSKTGVKVDRIKRIVSRFQKNWDIEYFERPFDYPIKQFQFLQSQAKSLEWFMYASDDEIPSVPLLENLYQDIDNCVEAKSNCVFYPFINYREYKPYFEVTDKMNEMHAYFDRKVAEEFGITVEFQWTAIRLLHNDGSIRFKDGSVHEGVEGRNGDYRSLYPVLHYKRFDGFILSALWQSVCDERPPNETNIAKEIRDEHQKAIAESKIEHNADSIYEHLKSGKISQSLKDWMWKYKDHSSPYVFPWFIVYYFEFHPEELPTDFWDSKLISEWKDHVLGNYQKLHVMNTSFHPLVKRVLLKRGIKEVSKGAKL